MADNHKRLTDLLNGYANNSLTQVEENELFDLLNSVPEHDIEPVLFELLERTEPVVDMERKERILGKVLRTLPQTPPHVERSLATPKVRRMFTWRRVAVAASIILMLGVGTYFLFFNKGEKQDEIVKKEVPHDVEAPKGTKAMITLADGRTVLLDSLASGTLAIQGDVNVVKTADGQIVYNGSSTVIEYNTFTNPRGSKVQPLTLSDGTKVWLNSESSLRYPTSFVGNDRKVEITGEAYFEAAHNADKPFIVKDVSRDAQVQVLGTHFNVNTYADEMTMKVTLLEGSVKVIKGRAAVLLKPGQQAQVTNEVKVVNGADLEEVMAWKNGRFELNGNTIEPIMRQIARWYDVEVEYSGPKPTANFMGGTSRQDNVSELLKILEQTKAVKFKIEGKKIVVMK